MGIAIEREDFDPDEYRLFGARLDEGLAVLRELLAKPGFGDGPISLGAELELSLVDAVARPSPVNLRVIGESIDPRLTSELDRFNLECNLHPVSFDGHPFAQLASEIEDALAEVRRAARIHDSRIAMVGILPTLRPEDLQSASMTDTARYRALSRSLQRLRHAPFRLRIDGADPLDTSCDDVTFEGANTSLQVHLRVSPRDFARVFNAAQMATVPVVAVSGNSPTFLGHRLWQETRIALFKQAVDHRPVAAKRDGRRSRVSFGSDWVREGAFELFAESVAFHEPLLPVVGDEDPRACLRAGGIPRLEEIRLHQGTVWSWNRPVYDPDCGGHLRIEMRSLPSGPSVIDMVANTAFMVGLALGVAADSEGWARSWPFDELHRAFYRAAREGLAAEIAWPPEPGAAPRPVVARDLVRSLIPVADAGLTSAGVAASERSRLLSVIEERVGRACTGAVWQVRMLERLGHRAGRDAALGPMLERYMEQSDAGDPVHTWPLHV